MSSEPESYTYAKAGVSIDAGNALVKAIGPLVKATRRPGADGEIGGFGGFFDPRAAGYKDPLLVAGNPQNPKTPEACFYNFIYF